MFKTASMLFFERKICLVSTAFGNMKQSDLKYLAYILSFPWAQDMSRGGIIRKEGVW